MRSREALGIDPRRARPARTACVVPRPSDSMRALEQHRARDRRSRCRASACSATASPTAGPSRRRTCRRAPALHRDDFERRADAECVVEQPRELADGHARAASGSETGRRTTRTPARASAPSTSTPPIGFGRSHTIDAARRAAPRRAGSSPSCRCRCRCACRRPAGRRRARRGRRASRRSARASRCRASRPARWRPASSRVRRLDHVVLHVGAEAVLRAEDRRERHAVGARRPVDDVPKRASIDAGLATRPTRAPFRRPDASRRVRPRVTGTGRFYVNAAMPECRNVSSLELQVSSLRSRAQGVA